MPGTRSVRDCGQPFEEGGERQAVLFPAGQQQIAPPFPRGHQRHQRRTQQQRHVTALRHFQQVGGEKHTIDDEERPEDGKRQRAGPAKLPAEGDSGEDAGADERAGDGDAVGGRQGVAAAERDDQQDDADEEGGVDPVGRRSAPPR